ncbi:MAG: hypothetical protein NVSMB24_28220 [Mucilaginibacter sp.]
MREKLLYPTWKISLIFLGLLLTQTVFAQKKITGKVIGVEDKLAVIGASVMIKGANTGTVTDVNGNFLINVKTSDVLVISYIGYDTVTCPLMMFPVMFIITSACSLP